jgi:hypothetical protein
VYTNNNIIRDIVMAVEKSIMKNIDVEGGIDIVENK